VASLWLRKDLQAEYSMDDEMDGDYDWHFSDAPTNVLKDQTNDNSSQGATQDQTIDDTFKSAAD